MQAVIKKWGNSPALRLSSTVMELAHLAIDQAVDIKVLRGKIVIERILPQKSRLNDLLTSITPENIHGEESFGPRVGKELL